MRIDLETLFLTHLEDETVVLDVSNSNYLTVNPAGTVLVKKLEQDVTRDELVRALIDQFEIDQTTAEADCDAFLAQLKQHGWLVDETTDGSGRSNSVRAE